MKVVFSERAFAAVMAETTERIQTETGGLFLGIVEKEIWYVIEAIDPGPKSVFEVAYFEYDQKYTQHLINKVANLYNEKLSLIGLWHRHPGSYDFFSTTDNGTNAKYAQMRSCGAISALVNIDPKFRLTMYHVGHPCKYTKISYMVGNNLIPDNYIKLKTPQIYEQIIEKILYSKKRWHPSVSFKSFMEKIKPLFEDRIDNGDIKCLNIHSEEAKNKVIDKVVSDISFITDEIGVELTIIQKNGLLELSQDTVDGVMKVLFVYDQKCNKLKFQYEGKNYLYEEGLFKNLYYMAVETQINAPLNKHAGIEANNRNKIINGLLRFIRLDRNGDN